METKRIYKVVRYEQEECPIAEIGIFEQYSDAIKSIPLDFEERETYFDFASEFYEVSIYEFAGNKFNLIKTEIFTKHEDDGEPYEYWEVMNISKN
jgi:hypothetical protein